ncbi:hypothetical protein C0J52_24041 [Blattella germanica]|nr:hypothetical protein C0J52_24041 [Blattella germanica]
MQYDTMEIILVFRNVFRLMPRNDKMLTISKMSCHATGFNKFIPSGPENIYTFYIKLQSVHLLSTITCTSPSVLSCIEQQPYTQIVK